MVNIIMNFTRKKNNNIEACQLLTFSTSDETMILFFDISVLISQVHDFQRNNWKNTINQHNSLHFKKHYNRNNPRKKKTQNCCRNVIKWIRGQQDVSSLQLYINVLTVSLDVSIQGCQWKLLSVHL